MSDLDKFISRVKHLDSQNAKETSFDVKFLVRVINEIQSNKPAKEEVIYTGGKFKDKWLKHWYKKQQALLHKPMELQQVMTGERVVVIIISLNMK